MESIIKEVGIAKGTFYYYFKAKEDILKAVVEQIASKMEAHFRSIVEMGRLTAIQKLKLMFRGEEKKSIQNPSVMEILHKPENRELQEQLNIIAVEVIFPLIAAVFEQGYKEGHFKRAISTESIQVIFAGSQFILDSGLFDWSPKQRTEYLKSLTKTLELLLDTKSGALRFIAKE